MSRWQCGECGAFNEGNDLSSACHNCGQRGDGLFVDHKQMEHRIGPLISPDHLVGGTNRFGQPNLQNIPIPGRPGKELAESLGVQVHRHMEADYSKVEEHILADYSARDAHITNKREYFRRLYGGQGDYMPLLRVEIAQAILNERGRQDAKWGGVENDNKNLPEDWQGHIKRIADEAVADVVEGCVSADTFTKSMVEIAAIAIAAIEHAGRADEEWFSELEKVHPRIRGT